MHGWAGRAGDVGSCRVSQPAAPRVCVCVPPPARRFRPGGKCPPSESGRRACCCLHSPRALYLPRPLRFLSIVTHLPPPASSALSLRSTSTSPSALLYCSIPIPSPEREDVPVAPSRPRLVLGPRPPSRDRLGSSCVLLVTAAAAAAAASPDTRPSPRRRH